MKITKISDGDKLTIDIEGRLDSNTAPLLSKELEASLDGVRDLTVDLSTLVYISSMGLRVLLSAQRKLRANNGTLVVKNPSELVSEILDLTRFNEILTIE